MVAYDEVIEAVENEERSTVLVANGFSRAWNPEIFDYANLVDAANFGDRDAQIRELFARFDTFDFERVMRALTSAKEVLSSYGGDEGLLSRIETDQVLLKNALVTAISDTHPDLPSEVQDQQFIATRIFLSRFDAVFSLNYDLLLYWARNRNNLAPPGYETDDGFRANRIWKGYETNQDVYFVHGGLHIYDSDSSVCKHAYTEEGVSIIAQVRENLEDGVFPLFVSEPSSDRKRARIERHPYLNYCYQALRSMAGTLVIFGHSMDGNDKHVFDQIKSSGLSKIFVSIYGDEDTEENIRTKANARAYLERPGIDVDFYQAELAAVWAL